MSDFLRNFVVRYTVPDKPEFSLVFPDRKVENLTREEADQMKADLEREGCRNVRIEPANLV